MREIVVVLQDVRSALNVGAIFRTCDGAGVNKLILTGITPYPPHPKVLKTALGAEKSVDFEYIKNFGVSNLKSLQNDGYEIYSLEEVDGAENFYEQDFGNKVVFVFGNEITGVSSEFQKSSDKTLIIPMKGEKNSLNVSTTVGIVTFTAANT